MNAMSELYMHVQSDDSIRFARICCLTYPGGTQFAQITSLWSVGTNRRSQYIKPFGFLPHKESNKSMCQRQQQPRIITHDKEPKRKKIRYKYTEQSLETVAPKKELGMIISWPNQLTECEMRQKKIQGGRRGAKGRSFI